MRTKKEKVLEVIMPLIIALFYPIACMFIKTIRFYDVAIFFNETLNQMITVMALFISFTMAYLSILITSSSSNVSKLKSQYSDKVTLKGNPVTLFQILLCSITYILIIEIGYLCLIFLQKFILYVTPNCILNIFIGINAAIFIHILLTVLLIIKNTYFSFWNPEEPSE